MLSCHLTRITLFCSIHTGGLTGDHARFLPRRTNDQSGSATNVTVHIQRPPPALRQAAHDPKQPATTTCHHIAARETVRSTVGPTLARGDPDPTTTKAP